jgi:hypothetical protein
MSAKIYKGGLFLKRLCVAMLWASLSKIAKKTIHLLQVIMKFLKRTFHNRWKGEDSRKSRVHNPHKLWILTSGSHMAISKGLKWYRCTFSNYENNVTFKDFSVN